MLCAAHQLDGVNGKAIISIRKTREGEVVELSGRVQKVVEAHLALSFVVTYVLNIYACIDR